MDLDLNHIFLNLNYLWLSSVSPIPHLFFTANVQLSYPHHFCNLWCSLCFLHIFFSISFCWLPLQTFSFVHCQCESIVSYFPSLSSLIFHRQCESYCLILFLFFPFFIANVKVSHSTFTLFRSFIFHRQCERFFFFFHYCSFIFHRQCDSIF